MNVKAVAQMMLYEWMENEVWEYMSMSELRDVDIEDTPVVQQIYAEFMGWA
jgi:hypothetical protein